MRVFPMFLLFCLATPSVQADNPLRIYADTQQVMLSKRAEIAYADVTASLEDIPAQAWQRHEQNRINLGFTPQAVWVRITLEFDDPKTDWWFLNLHNGNIREVEFLHFIDGVLRDQVTTGTSLPFATREIAYRTFNFNVAAKPGVHKLYLRLKTNGVITLQPELSKTEAWFLGISAEQVSTGAVFGALAILAIYNLCIFLFSRDVTFLLLFGALTGAFLWRAVDSGVSSQLLYPDTPGLHEYLSRFSIATYLACAVWFTQRLLKVSSWSATLGRLHLALGTALMLFLVVFPIFRYLPLLGLLLMAAAPALCMLSTLLAIRRGVGGACIYGTGIAVFIFLTLITLARVQGMVSANYLTEYASDVGIIVLGLLSSIALASRLAEDRLQKELALAEAASKSDFLANMSHELRTPLNAIVGFADLMCQHKLDPSVRESADRIQSSSRHLLGVINDVLDYSKIDAGKLVMERVPVNCSALLDHAKSMFTESAKRKGLTLQVIPPRDDVWFSGDPTRLTQVLVNLTGNAIKFTPAGTVTLHAQIDKDSGCITLVVRDTGIGMSEVHLVNVMRPFTQADASTTRKYGGTGLGLAICQQLAASMGGDLTIKSREGHGSTFSFRFPFEPCPPPRTVPSHSRTEPVPLRAMKILLVEDNATNQLLMRRMLEKLGTSCEVADNGAAAVDALQRDSYTLVFMDCQMPVLDGYAATRKIRAELDMSLPIIAMTANALDGDREKCLDAGMSDYMTKPVRLQDIRACLERWASADRPVA